VAPDDLNGGLGTPLSAQFGTLTNNPPQASQMSLQINTMNSSDSAAHCEITSLGTDPDGDNLTHTLRWWWQETPAGPRSLVQGPITVTQLIHNPYQPPATGLSLFNMLTCELISDDGAATTKTEQIQNVCAKEHGTFSGPATGIGLIDPGLSDRIEIEEGSSPSEDVLDLGPNGTIEAWVFWKGTRGGLLYSRWNVSDNTDQWIALNRVSTSTSSFFQSRYGRSIPGRRLRYNLFDYRIGPTSRNSFETNAMEPYRSAMAQQWNQPYI